MILSCSDIRKSFGGEELLHGISFHIEEHEKAALTGINGSGKSTLLKIIVGEESPESGTVTIAKDTSVGYLAQYQDVHGDEEIYRYLLGAKEELFQMEEELRSLEEGMKHASGEELDRMMEQYSSTTHIYELKNGFAARSEVQGVFRGLGFTDEDRERPISSLSGGQKTRVALGRLLLQEPDLLLLDEPTNHLDIDSVNWLEAFLSNYRGSVLLVSHDRYFLDHIVTKVIEIENGKALSYPGNYTEYSRKKSELRKAQYRAWLRQQNEIQHQEAVIEKLRQFNRQKSIRRAESREKRLDSMQMIEKPEDIDSEMRLTLKPRIESGKDVLTVEHLGKSFGSLTLFTDQSFQIQRGERVAVIGKNGTGKTTLLKMISHLEPYDQGTIRYGSKLHIGYFDQEHQQLDMDHTIFEEISDAYPSLTNTEIRNVLAAFLFTGDAVFQTIRTLSGGEQGRVSLAKLMLSEANFLILDEPTNHLDTVSREILEDALQNYTGTVLYVSHDRYFINRTATRILELVNHTFVNYIGNYDYYLEKKDELTRAYTTAAPDTAGESQKGSGRDEWLAQKEVQARQRKKERELQNTEEKINALEDRLKEIDAEFAIPETGTNPARCRELSEEQTAIRKELEPLYEKWEALAT